VCLTTRHRSTPHGADNASCFAMQLSDATFIFQDRLGTQVRKVDKTRQDKTRQDKTTRPCRAIVRWDSAHLSAVAGKPVQLQFRLVAASLYSFWVSANETCGESDGYLGGGGPGSVGGRDRHGSC
jgi:hypothetical protein